MAKTILITGASGALGRVLTRGLAEAGHTLRLTDIAPFPDALPPGAQFKQGDVGDPSLLTPLAMGTDAIVHFGAIPIEDGFEAILHANLRGTWHAFEAAKAANARVIFASSNHAIGFHERTTVLDEDCATRPDTYYGLSKVFGEQMGRLYYDKHGVESAHLRIGSCLPKPKDRRHLSTWLSYPDLIRLVRACVEVPNLGYEIVWGCSANPRRWWQSASWARIGYVPQDNAEVYAGEVDITPSDPISERYQGWTFTADGYSRA
jgi:uronate dehydrogenase